jgi:hypothetical protein
MRIRITCRETEVFEFAGSHQKPAPAREYFRKERRFIHEAEDFMVFSLGFYKNEFPKAGAW